MQISVDPEGTLRVATKTTQALDGLAENFDTCDRATDAVAAMLANGAPSVAASVRDVAAREGGHRTKAFAQAHAANASLRDAVGDFVRFGEKAVDEFEELRRDVERAAEHGVDKIHQGISEAGRLANGVAGEVRDIGEDAVDEVRDIGRTLSDLSKRHNILDL
jgi:hypothetical protein